MVLQECLPGKVVPHLCQLLSDKERSNTECGPYFLIKQLKTLTLTPSDPKKDLSVSLNFSAANVMYGFYLLLSITTLRHAGEVLWYNLCRLMNKILETLTSTLNITLHCQCHRFLVTIRHKTETGNGWEEGNGEIVDETLSSLPQNKI